MAVGIFDYFSGVAQNALGISGKPPPTLLDQSSIETGPLILGPGQSAVPTSTFGGSVYGPGLGSGATKWIPNKITTHTPVDVAASKFYQSQPGGEVFSKFPGAAKLWKQLFKGQLPTLRPKGQALAVGDYGGGSDGGAPLGGVEAGFGATSPLLLLGGAALALFLVVKLARK